MRYFTLSGLFSAAMLGVAALPAAAQNVIIRTPPGVGVTVIPDDPVPPPAVVVRPAQPGVHYYSSPSVDAAYASESCAWLYRRAAYTNDPYWWARYHDCAD